ncbi:MAG: PAS domain-containing protein [Pseudomonadota bacterium]
MQISAHKLLVQVTDPVLVIDQDRKIIFSNRAANAFWRQDEGALIGQHLDTFLRNHAGEGSIESDQIEELVDLERPTGPSRDWCVRNGRGQTAWLSCTISRLEGEEEVLYAAFLKDVSHHYRLRTRIEGKLSEATRRARQLGLVAEQANDSVVITDADGLTIWCNQAFTQISGYSLREVLGRKPGHLLQGPDTDPNTVAFIRSALRAAKPLRTEILNYHKDGRPYWIEVSITPIFEHDGTLSQFIAIERDITQARLRQEELTRAKRQADTERLRCEKILNSSESAILLLDDADRITFFNDKVLQLWQATAAEVQQFEYLGDLKRYLWRSNRLDHHAQIDTEEDFDAYLEQRLAELREVPFGPVEKQNLRPDGRLQNLLVTAIHLGDERMISSIDVTELEEARAIAEAASKAKSQFLATMSHEIRTPMNGIIGMTDLLSEKALNSSQQECAQAIRDSAHALLDLISDILDISKIEAGKVVIQLEAANVSREIEDVVQLLSTAAVDKGLELRVEDQLTAGSAGTAAGARWFMTDPARLRQILLNIVGNAIKFTLKGGVTIAARRIEGEPGSQGVVEISVSDTGIGIPADKIERIFDPFEQADGSVSRRFEGSGLGLSISDALVAAMGGEISIRSEEGKGTEVTFRLPMAPVPVPAPEARQSPRPALVGQKRAIVLSEPGSERVTGQILETAGFSVRTVSDPMGALASSADGADLLVIDLDAMGDAAVDALMAALKTTSPLAPLLVLASSDVTLDLPNASVIVERKPLCQRSLRSALNRFFADHRAPKPASGGDTSGLDLSQHEVLVVEDNKTNRLVMSKMLDQTNASATFVENGAEAVEERRSRSFDLILMDVSMPVMNGYDATREIRRIEAEQNVIAPCPIVGVTAHAMPEDRAECLASGMDLVLTKPVMKKDLFAALRQVFDQARS